MASCLAERCHSHQNGRKDDMKSEEIISANNQVRDIRLTSQLIDGHGLPLRRRIAVVSAATFQLGTQRHIRAYGV